MDMENVLESDGSAGGVDGNGSSYDAIVVGSGIGGLVAATQLAVKGARVLVLEKYVIPGGSSGFYERDGYTFDVGSSVMFGFSDKLKGPWIHSSYNTIVGGFCLQMLVKLDQLDVHSAATNFALNPISSSKPNNHLVISAPNTPSPLPTCTSKMPAHYLAIRSNPKSPPSRTPRLPNVL
ncbi:hypothetical protein RJ639_021727 [Escallonia herrerae]|uniref:Carotenoid isomerase n=1 Tax=Escallonia herrerae TaxID=1293975 RepID=A0AA88V7I9_9ASTE|nr:hypothetical protein RJ639_021727 [Escallonia herrerae]